MKKSLLFILFAAFGLMLTSCKENVEKKVDGYYEDMGQALRKGDVGKYAEISADFQKWLNGLSSEQRDEAARYALTKTDEISGSLGEAYGKALKKSMKSYEKAYKKAIDSYRDAIDDAVDELSSEIDDIDDIDDDDDYDW